MSSQGKCVRCLDSIDKSGLLCNKCLEADRKKTENLLPRTKNCCQCESSITRTNEQSNISWSKQIICDCCERENGLRWHRNNYLQNKDSWPISSPEYQKHYRKSLVGSRKRQISESKRRAQKVSTASPNINKHIEFLFKEKPYCFYCNSTLKLQIEHMIPLSRGGTHTEDNVTLACQKCNLTKGIKLPKEFIKHQKGE